MPQITALGFGSAAMIRRKFVAAVADADVALDDPVLRQRQVTPGERFADAGDPLGEAVDPGAMAGDRADAPVAEVEQVLGGSPRRTVIVIADAGVPAVRVIDAVQHVRDIPRPQQIEDRGIALFAGQHHAVDAGCDQPAELGGLVLLLVAGQADHQAVAGPLEPLLHRLDEGRVERIGDVRDQRADQPRAAGGQRAPGAVGDVVQLVDLVEAFRAWTGHVARLPIGLGPFTR